jgi:hypothetical protein
MCTDPSATPATPFVFATQAFMPRRVAALA